MAVEDEDSEPKVSDHSHDPLKRGENSSISGTESARDTVELMGESLKEGTIPLRVFNDKDIFELERDRIFGENWIFVGHESEIPEPGDYARRYIADTPVIFTRDEEGNIQVLFDSCRHRGTKVCRAEQGNTSHFRCPYHGWTYNNKGELVGVPHKQDAFRKMDIDEWGLGKPRFDDFEGLVFATISEDAPPLEEFLGDMTWYLDIQMNLADGGMEVYGEPIRYTVDTNWKIGAENFGGDDYHALPTHQSAIEVGYDGPDYGAVKDRHRVHVQFDEMPSIGNSLTIGIVDIDQDLYFDYPDEIDIGSNLSEAQHEVTNKAILHVGTVFPNFSFIHQGIGNGEVTNSHLAIRKWRPISETEVELWAWQLVPKDAPEEMKEEMYAVGQATFSPAGTWEPDDFAVWDGVSESAGSTFAHKRNIKQNYMMGNEIIDGMSEAHVDEEWPGPGRAVDSPGGFDESFARNFHRRWHEEMSSDD